MGDRPIVGILCDQGCIFYVNALLIVTPGAKAFHSLFTTDSFLLIAKKALHLDGTVITMLFTIFFAIGVIAEHCTQVLVEMLM